MATSLSARRETARQKADRARGALAALVIVALVAGIPAALVALTGGPLPSALPGAAQVLGALTRPDDGTLLLGLLEFIAWVAWALFTVSIVLEVWSRLRGIRVPSLGPAHRLAASLVATAALLVAPAGQGAAAAHGQPASGTPSAAGQPVPRVLAATTVQGVPAGAAVAAAAPAALAAPPGYRAHVVTPGEHLWRIAEEQLGDGERHREIYAATRGVVQPDGGRLERADLVRPGWTVFVPLDGAGPAPRAGSQPVVHIVERGDTLWDLAEAELGDGHRFPEIAEANGISNPSLIEVGQPVTIPGPAAAPAQGPVRPSPPAGAPPAVAPTPPPAPGLSVLTPLTGQAGPAAPAAAARTTSPAEPGAPSAAPVELTTTTPLTGRAP